MSEKRIQINSVVKNQVPQYVREDFPLVTEFLKQYYIAQEFQGAPLDLLQNIDKPDDELLFALILKNLSDRQISIDKKLIDYIIKRIDRSYGKIVDFIYKIDEVSLKKKRSINLSTIKEVLGE